MIENVTMTNATWAKAPKKFEAGVPNMAQAVGLGAAFNYLDNIGMSSIFDHEQELTRYGLQALSEINDLKIVGPSSPVDRGGTLSFTVGNIHPHDLRCARYCGSNWAPLRLAANAKVGCSCNNESFFLSL
jgi:cysteine desulfurase/selenocysteine lyase